VQMRVFGAALTASTARGQCDGGFGTSRRGGAARTNTFIYWPSGDRERQCRIFAEDVVPAAREALASATA
jgi:hypothetical protein